MKKNIIKRIIYVFLAISIMTVSGGMANADTIDDQNDIVKKTQSSKEYDSGIIPLGDIPEGYVFDEDDFKNPWTAPIPTYTEVESLDEEIHVTKSSLEPDDGIIPVEEIKYESDYTEWTAAIPTYTEVESLDGKLDLTSLVNTSNITVRSPLDYNSNPPTAEDSSLPDATTFHMETATYTDYMYPPSGSGSTGGVLGCDFDADFVSDSSAYRNFAREVRIYIYDYDAGSSMLYKTYSAAKSFDKSFWVGTINADHRYFFRIKVIGNALTWWNRLSGSFTVDN